MKVRFLTNLGTRDADLLELSHSECVCGAEMSVKKEVSHWLIAKGFAEPVESSKPAKQSESVEAVPDKPAVAKSKDPEISK